MPLCNKCKTTPQVCEHFNLSARGQVQVFVSKIVEFNYFPSCQLQQAGECHQIARPRQRAF